MKLGEDMRMSLRSIQKRPVESLLLVLGIALGIGATASGISMISHSNLTSIDLGWHTVVASLPIQIVLGRHSERPVGAIPGAQSTLSAVIGKGHFFLLAELSAFDSYS